MTRAAKGEYVPLLVDFFRNPKAVRAGRDGRDLYLAGLCHCGDQLTDGRILKAQVPILGVEAGLKPGSVQAAARALVEVGMWIDRGDAYEVHDYLRHNRSRADVERIRAEARQRMRRNRSEQPAEPSTDVRANTRRTRSEVQTGLTEDRSVNGFLTTTTDAVGGWPSVVVEVATIGAWHAALTNPGVRSPAPYARGAVPKVLDEHAVRIATAATERPGATCIDLAADVLGIGWYQARDAYDAAVRAHQVSA